MAHFAKIGLNNKVLQVVVVNNKELLDENGIENEQKGIEFLTKLTNYPFWIQTSYNSKIRKNYAILKSTYDEDKDAFIPPKPYSSWIFDEKTYNWKPPIDYPNDGKDYYWSEEIENWQILIEKPL